MRKSEGLKLPLVKYTDTPADDRTYGQLVSIMNKWLSEIKEDRLLKAEMRDVHPKAYPFCDSTKIDKGDKGGKSKSKGGKGDRRRGGGKGPA